MHVLVTGRFSWELMGSTAGNLIGKDIVCSWIEEAGITYDVALAKPFATETSADWQQVDSQKNTDIVFVCGPFRLTWPVPEFLNYFSNCRFKSVNLSMLQPLTEWNPFTLLYERGSSATINPDITFYAETNRQPVVGLLLVISKRNLVAKEYMTMHMMPSKGQLI